MGIFSRKKNSKKNLEAANDDSAGAPSENALPCEKEKAAAKIVIADPKAVVASDYKPCIKKRLKIVASAVCEEDLSRDIGFDGKGTLSCNGETKKSVQFYTAATGGEPLKLPLKLSAAELNAGKALYIEGVKASKSLENLELKLKIKKSGAKLVGSPATVTEKFTCVSAQLNYTPPSFKSALNTKDKEEQGVALLVHRERSPRAVGDLQLVLQPKDFTCKIKLRQKTDNTKTYDTDASGTRIELSLPKTYKHSDLDDGIRALVLEGTTQSASFLDGNYEIDIEDLQDAADGLPVTIFDFTVEDGSKPAPFLIPVKNTLTTASDTYRQKIKLLPDVPSATYQWSSPATKYVLSEDSRQTVLVTAKESPSSTPRPEELEVVVKRSGKKKFPTFEEKLGVVEIKFKEHSDNSGGYDAYEVLNCKKQNGSTYTSDPADKYDFVSVEKNNENKIIAEYKGADKEDIFFTSKDEAIGKPKVESPTTSSPWDMELEAKAKDKDETLLYGRICDKDGPIVAQIGMVVLQKGSYEAEFFKVEDSANTQTTLSHQGITGATITEGLKDSFKSGIAVLTVSGGASVTDIDYDTGTGCTENGKLDMEPGVTSAEQTKINTGCVSTKARIIYVHELRWSYYFRIDAAVGDTVIKIKAYSSAYLGYVGVGNRYKLEDTDGHSEQVTISAVDTATGDITITAALTNAFTTANKAALIWPLGGLSGNPAWVQDSPTADEVIEVIGHELGHQLGTFKDICETANLMYGVNDRTSTRLRHRPLDSLYPRGAAEKQWLKLPRP